MGVTVAYLVRHGETAHNVGRVYRGRADVPLNETGLAQAERLAELLANREISAIYSSPLSRAVQTARPLASRLGLAVTEDAALVDIDYGVWTGRPAEEAEGEDPELAALWREAPERVTFPGGESLVEVRDRTWPRLVELARRHQGGVFAAVAHRVVLKVLLAEAVGAGPRAFWRIRVDTASISRVDFDGPRATLVRTNEPSAPGAATGDF